MQLKAEATCSAAKATSLMRAANGHMRLAENCENGHYTSAPQLDRVFSPEYIGLLPHNPCIALLQLNSFAKLLHIYTQVTPLGSVFLSLLYATLREGIIKGLTCCL